MDSRRHARRSLRMTMSDNIGLADMGAVRKVLRFLDRTFFHSIVKTKPRIKYSQTRLFMTRGRERHALQPRRLQIFTPFPYSAIKPLRDNISQAAAARATAVPLLAARCALLLTALLLDGSRSNYRASQDQCISLLFHQQGPISICPKPPI